MMQGSVRNVFSLTANRALQTALVLISAAGLITGCGSNSHTGSAGSGDGSGPTAGEETTGALQVSSTANDSLFGFNIALQSISLTNAAGKTVTIFNTPTTLDYIHSNGGIEPLATVSIPQDVYTSATVDLLYPTIAFTFIDSAGSLNIVEDAYGYVPVLPVVTLAGPVTIEGTSMGLTLDLQVSQSATFTPGVTNGPYTITPTFTLTPFTIPAQPSTAADGKATSLPGRIVSISPTAESFVVTLASYGSIGSTASTPRTQTFTVAADSSTKFQHVSAFTDLAVGQFVDMNLALQQDGSLLATRIDVTDAAAADMLWGPLAEVDPSYSYLIQFGTQQQGTDLDTLPEGLGSSSTYSSATVFQTSGEFTNLADLPFNAIFDASALAPGQRVAIGSASISLTDAAYTQDTSITLLPQTIDGTVTGVSTSGNYTVYSVSLASDDSIASLNVANSADPADYTVSGANTVMVYVDATTQNNAATPISGSTYRFNGLLFNDGGTLRLVCGRIDIGVPK